MMVNLFMIFDTSTNSMFELNWMSMLLNMMLLPLNFWLFYSNLTMIFNKFYNIMYMEFNLILNSNFQLKNMIFYISIFIMIMINNIMGLFPYIFTSSSHMIFSISLSIPLWISMMLFGWNKMSNYMFSHMIPQGTPNFLMPFMVLIETISNIIRPMTLTIRLTSNMIAGHLLLTLLSNSINNSLIIFMILIFMIQIILLILEFSVSVIQSYVFSILSVLYIKEIN